MVIIVAQNGAQMITPLVVDVIIMTISLHAVVTATIHVVVNRTIMIEFDHR